LDALEDAEIALASMREHFDAAKMVVVGHSMGGRLAAHLSASGDVGAVVALAPWWPRDDADLIPNTCRLLVMHGTARPTPGPILTRPIGRPFVPATAASTPSGCRLRAPEIISSGNGPAGTS
jgi:pimeloyl-ACP methyl ester carboxylesterase